MKKRIKLLILCMLMLPILCIPVKAISSLCMWKVGEDYITVANSTENVSLTKEKGKENKIYTLHLKNYNGGPIVLEGADPTYENDEFIIELEGTNTITADDVGIDLSTYPKVKIQFQGTGNITINAFVPISNEKYRNGVYISPSETIIETKNEEHGTDEINTTEDSDINNTTDTVEIKEEGKKGKTKNDAAIILGLGIVGFILVIVLLHIIKPKKKKTTDKKKIHK